MDQILIIGAFDRYNYGDLLFPIIIEQELNTYAHNSQLKYYGLVSSDLSSVGGKPTSSISDFYESCNNGSEGNVTVIVAGGEAIDATWTSLCAALNPPFQLFCRVANKLSLPINQNWIAKRLMKGETNLPFTFSKNNFKNVTNVIFNSLGGSKVNANLLNKERELTKTLEDVDYLAVRDKITVKNLLEKGINARLVPDSAILMSKFFPTNELEKLASPDVVDYVRLNKKKYLFFQINKSRSKGNEKQIAGNLDKISKETGTEICLCPIGKALNHDDHIALKEIQPLMHEKSQLFDDVNIWDIMYLIANSKAYMGTSLHGAITAMSFARPYIGLTVLKLNSYLESWGVGELNHVIEFDNMLTQFKKSMVIDSQAFEQSRSQQIHEVEKSFRSMMQLLNTKVYN